MSSPKQSECAWLTGLQRTDPPPPRSHAKPPRAALKARLKFQDGLDSASGTIAGLLTRRYHGLPHLRRRADANGS